MCSVITLRVILRQKERLNKVEQLNKHETIAKTNIKKAFAFIIGDYYNMLMDEELDSFEPDEVKKEIYESAMVDKYTDDGVLYGRAPKEMRFAGAPFCKKLINDLFANDGDVKEILQHFLEK